MNGAEILKAMGMRRLGGVGIVHLFLIFALAMGSSHARKRVASHGHGAGWHSPDIDTDTDMTKQVWMDCRQELMDMKEPTGNCDMLMNRGNTSHFNEINSKADMNRGNTSHFNEIKSKAHMNKGNRNSSHSNEINSKAYMKRGNSSHSNEIDSKSDVNRGNTSHSNEIDSKADMDRGNTSHSNEIDSKAESFTEEDVDKTLSNSTQQIASNLAPSQVPALAPTEESPSNGPAPSLLAASSSLSPKSKPPVAAPEQPSPPPKVIVPPPAGMLSEPRQNVVRDTPSNKHDDSHDRDKKAKIIAIGAAVGGTCLLAALLLFCCLARTRKKVDPEDGQKDERPLLTFSLGNFSSGSSPMSQRTSSNKEFGVNNGKVPSFKLSDPMADTPSSEGGSGNDNGLTPHPHLKPPLGKAAPPPPGPPPPPPPAPRSRPPPPPKVGRPPPAPPKKDQLSALGAHQRGNSTSSEGDDTNGDPDAPKTKLKPFFWDKVLANPDQSMVWHEISAGSFQFNEEMIETLFGTQERNPNNLKKEPSSFEAVPQYIQIIDSKKAQNLSILLRALNVTTEEVCDALQEGNELPAELIQTLLKMAPTTDEELKLRLFSGDPSHLGPAERFLKVLVEIPFAFKRLESLLFMSSLKEEVSNIKDSFATLEVACNKLRKSRLFLKLLEAVLKTGNRMNDGTYRGGAQAFKLDTLLKLSDVKGIDGKTTLLHFVVQEIIRSEGVRAARAARETESMSSFKSEDFSEDSIQETAEHYRSLGLQVVSGLSSELEDVKKAAVTDADGVSATVAKLGQSLIKTRNFLNTEMNNLDEDSEFYRTLSSFVEQAEVDITWILEEDKRIMAIVKSAADYFHGQAGKDEGLRLFVIVRDFLIMLDKVCREVKNTATKPNMTPRKEASTALDSPEAPRIQSSDIRQRLFPAIRDRRMDTDSFSSDDESLSP